MLATACATSNPKSTDGMPAQVKPATATCQFVAKEMTCPNPALSGQRCVVEVSVDAQNNVKISAETIKVTAKSRIVWRLADGNFIAAKGDGVFVKNNDKDQFGDGEPTDDEQGQTRRKRAKHFKWEFENSQTGNFEYLLRFHKGGNPLECDPYINNEGGGR